MHFAILFFLSRSTYIKQDFSEAERCSGPLGFYYKKFLLYKYKCKDENVNTSVTLCIYNIVFCLSVHHKCCCVLCRSDSSEAAGHWIL